MSTLISKKTAGAHTRCCSKLCYDSKSSHCVCLCQGKNHGVGKEKAIENTKQMVGELLKDTSITVGSEILTEKPKIVEVKSDENQS